MRKLLQSAYYAQQGIRNGKKTTTRNIRNFGKHSELLKITDNPLAYVKEKIKKMNDEYRVGKVSFDCYTISRFLTYARTLDPTSKFATGDRLDSYFEQPDEDVVDEVTGEVISGLRRFGVSKEHRPNPIVEMGLFMDSRGIPITMCLHPGNTSEQLTAVPLEKEVLKMLDNAKFIYCADAGLGSYNIRKFNSMGGRAFIVTQSIKKLSDTLKKAVFNDYEYRLLSDDRCVKIQHHPQGNTLGTEDFHFMLLFPPYPSLLT